MAEPPLLDPDELEAIRAAVNEAQPAPSVDPGLAQKATPIALIADDRAAEQARPSGLKLANRWMGVARGRLYRLCGVKLESEGVGAEVVDGASLRDELALSWTRAVEVSGRQGLAIVSVGGALIEALAVRLLGASDDQVIERPPSSTALKVFTPVGDGVVAALADAWREEQGCEVVPIDDADVADKWRRGLGETDVILVITLSFGGALGGWIRLVARPETLVIPPKPLPVVPAAPGQIREALGAVPIDVRVQLGSAWMTMAQLKQLRPGNVLTLQYCVDDPVPVFCEGVVKAYGRAVVSRGMLAVEIVERSSAGSKS